MHLFLPLSLSLEKESIKYILFVYLYFLFLKKTFFPSGRGIFVVNPHPSKLFHWEIVFLVKVFSTSFYSRDKGGDYRWVYITQHSITPIQLCCYVSYKIEQHLLFPASYVFCIWLGIGSTYLEITLIQLNFGRENLM